MELKKLEEYEDLKKLKKYEKLEKLEKYEELKKLKKYEKLEKLEKYERLKRLLKIGEVEKGDSGRRGLETTRSLPAKNVVYRVCHLPNPPRRMREKRTR